MAVGCAGVDGEESEANKNFGNAQEWIIGANGS